MFFIRPFNRLSSTWRLALLQGITVSTALALCLAIASYVMRKDLEKISRRIVVDDLGEFAAVHRISGPEGVKEVFAGGAHGAEEAVQLVCDGVVVNQFMAPGATSFPWPPEDKLSTPPKAGVKKVELVTQHGEPVLVGRVRLDERTVLWHGRLEQVNQRYIGTLLNYLWWAGLGAAVIGLLPVLWYASTVREPVREMTASAESLARGTGGQRLNADKAVPELRDFAQAFNAVLERNAQLAAELQAANDHLAHDLRTPLARIRGNLDLLYEYAPTEEARDAAGRCLEEIDRASSLVQAILTVRAGEHQILTLHREPTSLWHLLAGLVELYTPSAQDAGLEMNFISNNDLVLSVDVQRLTQAVASLLDNALAYTPAPGEVTVELETTEDVVHIHVRDTGPGVPMMEREQIWERYIRGSASSEKKEGIGLGLSLVRAVARAHDGSATVCNTPEGGADFVITLPRRED